MIVFGRTFVFFITFHTSRPDVIMKQAKMHGSFFKVQTALYAYARKHSRVYAEENGRSRTLKWI